MRLLRVDVHEPGDEEHLGGGRVLPADGRLGHVPGEHDPGLTLGGDVAGTGGKGLDKGAEFITGFVD